MIVRLYDYFGLVGIASILAWMTGAGLLMLYACGWRRTALVRLALLVAVIAYALAKINSVAVSAIEEDQSELYAQVAAQQEALRQAELAAGKGRSLAEIRFDPSVQNLARAAAGETTAAGNIYEQAAQGRAYRAAGKQQRDSAMLRSDAVGASTQPAAATQPGDENNQRVVRKLKGPQLAQANAWDRLNLLIVRLLLPLALTALLVDYFRRHRQPFAPVLAWPIRGSWYDLHLPPEHALTVQKADGVLWRWLARQSVRKGETILLVVAADPWPQPQALRRTWLGPALPRLDAAMDLKQETTDLLESLWYGRGYAVLSRPADQAQLLAVLLPWLRARQATRARSQRLVNLVWDAPLALTAGQMQELAFFCRECNWRLIVPQPSACAGVEWSNAQAPAQPPVSKVDQWLERLVSRYIREFEAE